MTALALIQAVTPPADAGLVSTWTIVIGIVTAVLSGAVGLYTARSARAANRETTQMTGWKDLVEGQGATIDRQGRTIEQIRADREEDEEGRRKERAAFSAQLRTCQEQIDDLRRRFAAAERRERALILWARDVVRLMRSANVIFPPPPPGVAETDPDGIPSTD